MYVGHLAVALAIKGRDPRIPLVPLALACSGPDWVEVLLMIPHKREGMAVLTHSIPAIIVGGAVAALAYAATRRPGAWMIFAAWVLHWPADLLTGRKPLIASTPLVGLDLYSVPVLDFLLESAVVALGCALYARRFRPVGEPHAPLRADVRRAIVLLAIVLALVQGMVDIALGVMRNRAPTASLAYDGRGSHVGCFPAGLTGPESACLLLLSARTQSARERWRRTVLGA